MIEGNGICKSFDGFFALQDANFHVRKGSVYGLVGPNGAGKSTLLRHITGIFKPDAGEIMVDGQPVFENEAAKEKIAFIPDDIFYFHQANIMDMAKYYKGIYKSFDEEMLNKLLQLFLEIDSKRPLRRMSKGMQKQAAFILALSCKPEILILDEPVDGLDPVMRRQVWSLVLSEVEKSAMTVLVSSHNLRELEDVCDYVGIMHKGSIVIERSLAELQGNITKIQTAFEEEVPDLGESLEIMHHSNIGKVHTYIVRGEKEHVASQVKDYHPMFVDVLPLTLEEIFIYELGGMDYEVNDILF